EIIGNPINLIHFATIANEFLTEIISSSNVLSEKISLGIKSSLLVTIKKTNNSIKRTDLIDIFLVNHFVYKFGSCFFTFLEKNKNLANVNVKISKTVMMIA